jgi:uncharacterized protein (DUF488 family)
MLTDIYTIGVYGITSDLFFKKLADNKIDTFIDIRRRRAVRGSLYSFVNSNRLQNRLKELGIKYFHILDLAPTKEIREAQINEDLKSGVSKRERAQLSQTFISQYKVQILENFNSSELIDLFNNQGSKRIVLFCVEKEPQACHRSLVAEEFKKHRNLTITDL